MDLWSIYSLNKLVLGKYLGYRGKEPKVKPVANHAHSGEACVREQAGGARQVEPGWYRSWDQAQSFGDATHLLGGSAIGTQLSAASHRSPGGTCVPVLSILWRPKEEGPACGLMN